MKEVIFKFSYGLFVLSAKDGEKDNACIINTAIQVTDTPFQVSMCLNKNNYTHDLIMNTKKFNISFLSEEVTFDVFTRFGFQSGRDVNKFEDFADCERSENGLYYLTKGTNAMASIDVKQTIDLGTHTMFIGEVTEEKILSESPSCTYTYYQNSVKPKPQNKAAVDKKLWVCGICGYVYDMEKGDPKGNITAGTPFEKLPEDWVCPLCKHGKDVFEEQ